MGEVHSNKAKIAKRVIEVLEFFDDDHPSATVMDIVRRYNRPQSSTSELLSSLVDLGLLYKDAATRSYTLTPRAAILGSAAQPAIIRDGRLTSIVDRLSAQTGLGVGVFGLIGLNAQIFSWRSGVRTLRTANPGGFGGGMQDVLCNGAVGRLLLSTVGEPRRSGMIRRMNAEASDDKKFGFAEMLELVQNAQDDRHAVGTAGFGSIADAAAILLPGQPAGHPVALAFVYEPSEQVDCATLVNCLKDAIARSSEELAATAVVHSLSTAA